MKPKIIFTGGGTAGHVTPNLALIEAATQEDWQVNYIGSKNSVEESIINSVGHIPFYAISSGKLRRYFSWQNFFDPFRILLGIIQSYHLLRKLKANVVFSKGGFVAFPVVLGAWLNRIPVVIHESDMTPGLANKLSFPFADKICVNFELAKKYFKQNRSVEVTGTPIRPQLFLGSRLRGLEYCHFTSEKPCLLVMGGSQGASSLNAIIRQSLSELTQKFQVIHLCGKGKKDISLNHPGYCQFEFIDKELPDLFAAADLVVSRAGANSLCELLALQKPHVLVPLSLQASRGDQIQNAHYFSQLGVSTVLDSDTLTSQALIQAVKQTYHNKDEIITKIKALQIEPATTKILTIIKEQLHAESRNFV
ncbi:undecaprenyldiphospho-muramoylpentapeptide beta-N-acetylglucosaminyltransferase [Legionella gresilensis]|uniref:undecaprenyldiphospho-muramoylpentapeptide beta-N-acetylglucosaminyltransferase n=1 Tax=Legionella gresilensis TaxID=91823 RepID=UPI001040F36B|nr:undecaprenyldiphospho-muramoylpentapeptide beta-N-acetylglucosaminyltransferase [Legionella gresilensis]